MRWFFRLCAALVAAGCAAPPALPPGTEVRAEMVRLLTVQDLERDTGLRAWLLPGAARRDAGDAAAFAAEGRLAVTRCGLVDFEVLFPLAVLPRGIAPEAGELVRVRLGDGVTADEALGIVTEPAELERGSMPRASEETLALPPWTATPPEAQPDPFVAAQYVRVTGAWLVRCVVR